MNQSKIMRRFKANLDVRIYILKADLDSETTSLLKTLESTIEDNDGLSVCVYDAMPFYNKLNTDTQDQIIRIHQQSTRVLSLGLTQDNQLPVNVIEAIEQEHRFDEVPTEIEQSKEVDVENAEVVEHDDDLMGVAPVVAPAVVAPVVPAAVPAAVVIPPPPVAPPIIPPAPVPPALPVVAPVALPRDLVEIDMDNWYPDLFNDDRVPVPVDVIIADDVVAPKAIQNDFRPSQADINKAKRNPFIKQTIENINIEDSLKASVNTFKQQYESLNKMFVADTEHMYKEKTSTMPETRPQIEKYIKLSTDISFRECNDLSSIFMNETIVEYANRMMYIANVSMSQMYGMLYLLGNYRNPMIQNYYGGNREDIKKIKDDFNYWIYRLVDVTRASPYEPTIDINTVDIIYEAIINVLTTYPIDPRNDIHDIRFQQVYEEIVSDVINVCLFGMVTEDFFEYQSLKFNRFIKEFNNICLTIYFHIMLFIVNHIEDKDRKLSKEYIMLYRILLIANNFTNLSNYKKINNYLAYEFEEKVIDNLHNSFMPYDFDLGFNDDIIYPDGFENLDGGKIPLNSKISKYTEDCINLQYYMYYNQENSNSKYYVIKHNYRKFLNESYKIYSLNTLILRLKIMFLMTDSKITYKDHIKPMLLKKMENICHGTVDRRYFEFEQLLTFYDITNEQIMKIKNADDYPYIIDDLEYLNKSLGLLQEKYQKIVNKELIGNNELFTLINNTMASNYEELYKLINRIGYNPEARDVIIDTIINETTYNETEFALMLYNAIKKQEKPSEMFVRLVNRDEHNPYRLTEKFVGFLISVNQQLGYLLSDDNMYNRICDYISKQPRNIQTQIFKSFESVPKLLEFIKLNNSPHKELTQRSLKDYETISKNVRTFKYKPDSKFDCVIIPLELFDCAKLTDITFESIALINNMQLKHLNPKTLRRYYYFIYHQQLCRITVDDLVNNYIDYNMLLQPNTPIKRKAEIMLGSKIINNVEEYRRYLVIEKYCLLNNKKLTYDDILYEDLETMFEYRYDHVHRVMFYSNCKKDISRVIDYYTGQYYKYFRKKKLEITLEITNKITNFRHNLLSFFIEAINGKIPKKEIISEYIKTIGLYGLNGVPLKYNGQLPDSLVPKTHASTINKLIRESQAYRFNKLKYITFDGINENGEEIKIPYLDYDFGDVYDHRYITSYICSRTGPLRMVRDQDSIGLVSHKWEIYDQYGEYVEYEGNFSEMKNIENIRAYPPYIIDNYNKLLLKNYIPIAENYDKEDVLVDWGSDVGKFEYEDWTIRYISNLNYVFGVKISTHVENYDKKYPLLLNNFWHGWYEDFDPTTEICMYVKLSDFPKFINDNKTKTIKYIEYHYDMGLFIRISKNPRPQKRWFEKLKDSFDKSNKSDNSLFGMFNEMFINDDKDEILKKFTIDCVLRTIIEHIIVNILKLNPVKRRTLFTDWINKIITEDNEDEDDEDYLTICKKYFSLFCEIITNSVVKRNLKDLKLEKVKIEEVPIYKLTDVWARQNPRAKINIADILLIQQIISLTEPIDWRTLIEDYNGRPVNHLMIDPGILDFYINNDETYKTYYDTNMYDAFENNLYKTSKIFITNYKTIPFIEIINSDFLNPIYEVLGEYDPNKFLNDGTRLIHFDQKYNRLTRLHNILATKEFIDYRKYSEAEKELPSKSLLIKESSNSNKIFFDYTIRLNETWRIDIEKDFVYKFSIYDIRDIEDVETKTLIATLIQNYALSCAFVTRDNLNNILDIFKTTHDVVSKLIGKSFRLPGDVINPYLYDLEQITDNIFVTGQYEDAETMLNEVDKKIKPKKPLPENKNKQLALLKNTFENLINFILLHRPNGILKSIRETLEKIVKNMSLDCVINNNTIIHRLDLSSWTIMNMMKIIRTDGTIRQSIYTLFPKDMFENREEAGVFMLHYYLFIFNMLITTKTRLLCIIDGVFNNPDSVEIVGYYDGEYQTRQVGLSALKITEDITDKFTVLSTPFELHLFKLIEVLYDTKELNKINIQRVKTEDVLLKLLKEKIQRSVGFELEEDYINELIRKYVEIITKTQTYKNGEIESLLVTNVNDVIVKIQKHIGSKLIATFTSIINESFNDDTINEYESFKIVETFKKFNYENKFYIRSFSYTITEEELKREFGIMFSTIKYAVKLNPNIDPTTIIDNRYYYMLMCNPSLINGLLMSPEFISLQERYNKTLTRKVFNRIIEKGLFNLNAYPINHQLILQYVYHTKKDYLKYIPYYIWMKVEQELHYQDEPEMKLYGGKPKEKHEVSTRSSISTFAYLLLALVFVILVVVIIVVLFIKTKPLTQYISTTK